MVAALFVISFLTVRHVTLADLRTPQELPDDVRTELDVVWTRFNEVFSSRRRCFDDVTVRLVGRVEGGDARYVVADALVEIDIPTSPRRFRESLAHEFAHHIEHTCGAFDKLRVEIAEALEVPADSWFSGESWETTPSEIYAEGVAELVNGERVRHVDEVVVSAEITTLIEQWATN